MKLCNFTEEILNNSPGYNSAKFSGASTIDSFFEDIPEDIFSSWPLDLSKQGCKTEYVGAIFDVEQAGFVKVLQVNAVIRDSNSSYIVSLDFKHDYENLNIDILSLYKESGKSNIPNILVNNLKNFVTEYDNIMGNKGRNSSSIFVHAKSGEYKSVKEGLNGGYFWSNQGFKFDSTRPYNDLLDVRKNFVNFCSGLGIKLDDKDIKKIATPCEFSAFDCGVNAIVDGGKVNHIGKAFMATQSWRGEWRTSYSNDREEMFAKEFNNIDEESAVSRRKNAIDCLGKDYFKMLKKYAKRYSEKNEHKSSLSFDKMLSKIRFFNR